MCSFTGISSEIDGVIGVAAVGAEVRTLGFGELLVYHQLDLVPDLLGHD